MNKMLFDISVIIPFRYDPELPYLIERLAEQCNIFSSEKNVEFIVVDSGSPKKYQADVEALCSANGISYVYHESAGQKFSIGEARDFGVEHARGRLVSFLDVDLRVEPGFWGRLIDFSKSFGVFEFKRSFFVIPCLYLSPEGSSDFYKYSEDGEGFFIRLIFLTFVVKKA